VIDSSSSQSLRMARWYSPLQVQSPRILFGLFVLDSRHPLGVLCLGTVPRRRAVLLLRCGTSSPSPKFTAESKVRCVPLFPFANGTLALPSKSPHSPYNLSYSKYLSETSRSPNSLCPNVLSPTSLSPNSLR